MTGALTAQENPVVDEGSEASTVANWKQFACVISPNKAVFMGDTYRDPTAGLNSLFADSLITMGLGFGVGHALNMYCRTLYGPMRVMIASPYSIVTASSDPDDFMELEARRVEATLNVVFFEARDEEFENGMESSFSEALNSIVARWEAVAVEAIDRVLKEREIGIEVFIETLRQIGQMEHERTRPARLKLLEPYLRNNNIRIRYAACLGLAALDDYAAISAVRKALDVEPSDNIRVILLQVINQLENI